MGQRGKGGRGGRGRGRGGRGGGGRSRDHGVDNRCSFENVPKSNEKFERYYNELLNLDGDEKEEFWGALKRELPNSFRFAGSKGHAIAVQKQLKERYIPEISAIKQFDGRPVEPPAPVPWYPDELAWSMTTSKTVIRKSPPFAMFQKFLVSETSVGNISRQEIVSMIPPLVMDLRPGMTVLDMCAAPGSKAAQLLEMVHHGEETRVHAVLKGDGSANAELELDPSDDGRATGLLIANDADYKRSHMLIHQLKRLSSPNLIVTNHDATMYPSIKLPPTPENPALNRYLKFDRILADVPCSGDGTTRKNVNLWKDWNPGNALGLYITQVRILVRALQMLKAGGRVVYSTCSMNPVENEAVVASAIERCGGPEKVKLVSSDDQLPLLKRRPGLKTWTVMDKKGRVWKSWAELQKHIAENGEDDWTKRLVEGMFPPTDEAMSTVPLDQCMRVYAHLQDTGGFFITILEKQSEFKAKPESENKKAAPKAPITAIVDEIISAPTPENGGSVAPKIEAADELTHPTSSTVDELTPAARQNQEPESDATHTVGSKRPASEIEDPEVDGAIEIKKLKTEDTESHALPPKGAELDLTPRPADPKPPKLLNKYGQNQAYEEAFKYIPGNHDQVQEIETFYKLSERFPRDRFLVRNATGEPAKTIYYTTALIRDILTENEGKGIKFIHAGVKMFMKQDVQGEGVCRWRIQSEGMPILQGYVGEERVVNLCKKETLRTLLIEMFPKVSGDSWKELGEIGERVRDIGMGCCVLRIEPAARGEGEGGAEDAFTERMVLPLWRSLHSLNLMLAKEDRSAMLLRIFNDTTPLVNNSVGAQREAELKKEKLEGGAKMEVEQGDKVEGEGEDVEMKVDVDAEVDVKVEVDGADAVADANAGVQRRDQKDADVKVEDGPIIQ
ncbi:tRNA (cytosine-5-)-methyltransferase ncl1 [Ciborinia camelliae]|nr:tRNA (cytosine-5-)-methyltransferase ncl1 [Ciborinia camelliae]